MPFLIPSRKDRPSDDPIFALNSEAKARALAGDKVVNATVGALLDDQGRVATLASVVETLHETPASVAAAYAPISGSADFLKGVIADLFGDGPLAKWAVAAATPGGTGALHLAIANFLGLSEALLTTSYYWGPYKTLADECDRALRTFSMFDREGRFDIDDFAQKLDGVLAEQGRALVLLNSPCHNPTGYSFDLDEWRAIREVIEARSSRGSIALCLDAAYARFGAQPLDAVLTEISKIVPKALLLVAWSASKTFLQYGLRVGALVAVHPDDDERRRIGSAFSYSCRGTWSNVNAGGMAGLARILNEPERKARVDAERRTMVKLLAGRVNRFNELAVAAKLVYPRYDGGFFTTVFTSDAFGVAEALKSDGVFVVPQSGAIRIALCSVAEADIPRLVESVARHVKPV